MNRPNLSDGPLAGSGYVSTSQVAQALGVSVTTVKRWVDDGILPAHRTAGGHRKLLLSDVSRLIREGRLPQADLARLDPRASPTEAANPEQLLGGMVDALVSGDSAVVRRIIQTTYSSGYSITQIADEIIAPSMRQIGDRWQTGSVPIHQEHRATQLMHECLYELKGLVEANAETDRPVAICASPADDRYSLPTLLAQIALLDSGWDAINLSNDTPMHSLVQAVVDYKPRLVCLSVASVPDSESFVSDYRKFYEIAESRQVAVAIGGRGLTEELRAKIPYTMHGDGLTQLIAFARTIHPRPWLPKRGRPPIR